MLVDIYIDTPLASTPLRNSSVTTRSFASLPLGWAMWEDAGLKRVEWEGFKVEIEG